VRVDPLAAGELVEQRSIEAAPGAVIDILDDGMVAQSGIAQPGRKALVATMGVNAGEKMHRRAGVKMHHGWKRPTTAMLVRPGHPNSAFWFD
jgi:hypothetical protein